MARTNPARDIYLQCINYHRKRFSFADYGTVLTVGVIPKGSLIIKPISGVHIITAFNAATNDFLELGPSTDDNLWGTNLSLEATTFVPLDEAVGTYYCAVETTIIATPTQSGTAATAGDGIIIIAFIPPHPPSTTS